MNRSEIVAKLRPVLENGIDNPTLRAAISAAIALLTPEPITEDGLRGLGFQYKHLEDLCVLSAGVCRVIGCLHADEGPEFWLQPPSTPDIEIHITDMQHLRSVIAALEGGTTNESEAV